ncbi:MAG: hypothetical protein HYX53_17720 [Chloroflexi bacterium]|nr:hypothetical protein [Chloroflexota bacterium]
MRYMVRFEASIEQGAKVDGSPGGAGAAIGKILELFKPESFYVSVFKRELTMIVNSDDLAALSEAAHVVQLVAGANLEVTPVMTADEAMAILPPAITRAVAAARELGF